MCVCVSVCLCEGWYLDRRGRAHGGEAEGGGGGETEPMLMKSVYKWKEFTHWEHG